MEAIVYTRDDNEYNLIKATLENEVGLIDVDRHPLNGGVSFWKTRLTFFDISI